MYSIFLEEGPPGLSNITVVFMGWCRVCSTVSLIKAIVMVRGTGVEAKVKIGTQAS